MVDPRTDRFDDLVIYADARALREALGQAWWLLEEYSPNLVPGAVALRRWIDHVLHVCGHGGEIEVAALVPETNPTPRSGA